MKRSVGRALTVALASVATLVLFAGAAFAHYCSNASKPAGNGSAGVLFADVSSDFEVVPELSTVQLNGRGNIIGGGFMDLHVDFDGDGTADMVLPDVFAHAGLPPKALLAAGCGQGVETYVPFFEEACPLP